MFPIRDHNPSGRTPYVTYALIAANVLIFASYYNLFSNDRALFEFYITYGIVPVIAFENPMSFVTHMFLHGGIMHLGGNMLFLWIFGDNLEDEMGHVGFLIFYVLGGFAAAMAQYLSDPASQVPMVGASGAIAAVMGGYLLLFPKAKVDVLLILVIIFRIFTVPAWIVLGIWFALQLGLSLATPTDGGGVAYWAHAGGFIAGLVFAVPIWMRLGGADYWDKTHMHPPHPEAQYRVGRTSIPRVRRRR